MLDVHMPERRIHEIRDFFIHLLTITVGLLIALGLEDAAQAVHHRHQRQEAQETIRHELEENRAKLQSMQPEFKAEHDKMVAVLEFLESKRDGKAADGKRLTLGFHESPLHNTGWRTALAMGTLSYMDYATVQKYSGAYEEQQLFEDAEAKALTDYEQLDGYVATLKDPNAINPQDVIAAIPDVRKILADISAMADIGRGTLEAYDEALK